MTNSKAIKGDLTEGPIFGKIIVYSVPLILTGVLQLLYNAADTIVAGRWSADGEAALAAVGSCGALINLIVNLFLGLATGAGVCVAQSYGAQRYDDVRKTVHTAVPTAAVLGVAVAIFGYFSAETLLVWTGVEESVLAEAAPYMRAYMLGMPASLVYNYCATMLRSTGDTSHPLIFLSISGVVNIALNLLMVIVFGLGALGVGIATAVSTWLSMILILSFMLRTHNCMRFEFKKMHIYGDKLWQMVRFGIPAGFQGCLFSLSNVMIQSAVNGFERPVVAGNTAAANIDGFIYTAMNAVYHAALTFVGQNVGAKKYDRIPRIAGACYLVVTVIGVTMSALSLVFGHQLLGLYAPGNEPAIEAGLRRMIIVGAPYFLCGLMDVGCGIMRGMGSSITPMVVSLCGSCLFRIVWIKTIFEAYSTTTVLYISYPISWTLTALVHLFSWIFYLHLLKKRSGGQGSGSQDGSDSECTVTAASK